MTGVPEVITDASIMWDTSKPAPSEGEAVAAAFCALRSAIVKDIMELAWSGSQNKLAMRLSAAARYLKIQCSYLDVMV